MGVSGSAKCYEGYRQAPVPAYPPCATKRHRLGDINKQLVNGPAPLHTMGEDTFYKCTRD